MTERDLSRGIHVSELKTFLACRLQWFWGAMPPIGKGLERKVQPLPFLFGKAVHAALQAHYDYHVPSSVAFSQVWAEETCALQTAHQDTHQLDESLELGQGMLEGYDLWAEEVADKRVTWLATETDWQVEVAGCPLAGRYDGVVATSTGLWVVDFKTTKSGGTGWAWYDLQPVVYILAARQMLGPDVRGVQYRFLRKHLPRLPLALINQDGRVTTRKDIGRLTTGEYFDRALKLVAAATARGIAPADVDLSTWGQAEEEAYRELAREYYQSRATLKRENAFFWTQEERFSQDMIDRYLSSLIVPALQDMQNAPIIPSGLGASFAVCGNCQFQDACRAYLRTGKVLFSAKEFRRREEYAAL